MYLIEILHQTTTLDPSWFIRRLLYLIEILHQTTTGTHPEVGNEPLYLIEILHQTTTGGIEVKPFNSCILSKFYIKPQLSRQKTCNHRRCILSKFYIKPQHFYASCCAFVVVSYRNSTSNHNVAIQLPVLHALYLIEILHQTTTMSVPSMSMKSCILSKFYIKPQQRHS